MEEPGQLSFEEIKERLDFLEARVTESEGDSDLTSIYWDELRHLRQVYDRMVMDSQGKGIVMMQDIMDKSPETRENYVSGVPVASTEAPGEPHVVTESNHAESNGDEGHAPAVNLTINVNGGSAMEPKIDESLMRSQGDIRIPLDIQMARNKSRLEKSKKSHKHSKECGDDCKEELEGIDIEKVDASDKKNVKEKPEAEDSRSDADKADKKEIKRLGQSIKHEKKEISDRAAEKGFEENFFKSETETLAKYVLARKNRQNTVAVAAGYWLNKRLQKSCKIDFLARVVRETLEKSSGASIVMGIPVSDVVGSSKTAYARIIAANAEIQRLQEQIQGCNEPDVEVDLNRKLRAVYEKLALAVMQSEGLGLKTEDMIVDKPDTRFSREMTQPVIGVASKSQKGDLEKSGKHFSGKLSDGTKYAITMWGKKGEITKSDAVDAVKKNVGGEDEVRLVVEG